LVKNIVEPTSEVKNGNEAEEQKEKNVEKSIEPNENKE